MTHDSIEVVPLSKGYGGPILELLNVPWAEATDLSASGNGMLQWRSMGIGHPERRTIFCPLFFLDSIQSLPIMAPLPLHYMATLWLEDQAENIHLERPIRCGLRQSDDDNNFNQYTGTLNKLVLMLWPFTTPCPY